MYNSPGLTQPKSFTVNPTVVKIQSLVEHVKEQENIDFHSTRHAMVNYGSARRKVRALMRASEGNQLSTFSVY
jgi:hypothetical protein